MRRLCSNAWRSFAARPVRCMSASLALRQKLHDVPPPTTSATPVGAPCVAAASATVLGEDELERIVRLMENDPRILMEVVASMDPQHRRRLIVAGGAMEWFGAESAATEVANADADHDLLLSPKDFDHWFESALRRRRERQKPETVSVAAAAAAAASASASTTNTTSTSSVKPNTTLASAASTTTTTPSSSSSSSASTIIPLRALMLIALEAGLPFVGFGFLDNTIMILAGDAIDGSLGFYLNCSVLASAAMGNVCSGLLGMQVHGLVEKAVQKLSFDVPLLTDEQMRDRRVFFAGHMGGTVGIMIGLILGMLPLLFIESDGNEKLDYAVFQRWDNNGNGVIELPEFAKALTDLGVDEDTHAHAANIIHKYGENDHINFEQFCRLKKDLREGKHIYD